MKKRLRGLNIIVYSLVALLAMLVPGISVAGTEIDLNPGYIAGTVNAGSGSVSSFSMNAVGGGYYSSKSVSGANNAMTVQGGDWNYTVSASAGLASSSPGYAYTNVYFSPRQFPVQVGETKTNTYDVSGAVRFHLNITGDPYTTWSASAQATKDASAGNEQTRSDNGTGSSSTSEKTWVMHVVPNQQIRIYVYVYIDNNGYYFWTSPTNYLYKDIAPGETVDINLDIDYKRPIPYCEQYPQNCPPPPPPPSYEYGAVQGTVYLDLAEPGSFYRHTVNGYHSFSNLTNPGTFNDTYVQTGSRSYGVTSYFDYKTNPSYWRQQLNWPTSVGVKTANVQKDQIATLDFSASTGRLMGKLKFTGTLQNSDINNVINFYVHDGPGYILRSRTGSGSYFFYNLSRGVGRLLLYPLDVRDSYRFFLPEGSWMPFRLSFGKTSNSSGYNQITSVSILDFNHYYDGAAYNYGSPTVVTPGSTVVQDREYCLGSVLIRFRDYSGGTMSSPQVSGYGEHYNSSNKVDIGVNVGAAHSIPNAEAPDVEIHGPTGLYFLTGQATAQDGTLISFPTITTSLECGVRKCSDRKAPSITLTSPVGEFITNAQSVTVSGTTTDDFGIQGVTVNDNNANFWYTNNPVVPNEVAFTYDLALSPGKNHIRTFVENTSCNSCFDERNVYVDRWVPTVTIAAPADGSLFSLDDAIAVKVDGADQGYGFTLKVTLDGNVIHESTGAVNEAAAEPVSYQGTVGPLAQGTHVIRAEIADAAGNSAAQSVTIMSNRPPVADAGPYQTIECAGPNGSAVTLDGSNSTDPDGDTLTYTWTEGADVLAQGVRPVVMLGTGTHTITLTVADGKGGSAQSAVAIIVRDTVPPATSIQMTGSSGTNEWYTSDVTVNLIATDACSGVREIRYTVDGMQTAATGSTASFTIAVEAVHDLSYFAEDNTKNRETAHPVVVRIDKAAPVTEAILTGTPGTSCYSSNVTVTLTAGDNLSGVAATRYRVNNGPWQAYTGAFMVSAEGAYVIGYLSSDAAGNNETEKTISFLIDKTAPEAVVRFDPATKDIKVYNGETGAEAAYVVLPYKHEQEDGEDEDDCENAEHYDKDGKHYDKDGSHGEKERELRKELRQYTLSDCANNTLVLRLKHKKAGHEVKVEVVNMQYNNGSVIEPAKNKLQAEYAEQKGGTIKELEQKEKVRKQFDVQAKYSARKNETSINVEVQGQKEKKETLSGMTILELLTDKGSLAYRY